MKLPAAVSLMLLLGSITLTAQTADQNPILTLNYEQPQPNLCPISLRAQHTADGELLKAGANGPRAAAPKGQGQGLHLTITGPNRRQITQATITVRSLTSNGSPTPALSNQDSAPPTSKTMEVRFTAGDKGTAFADIWVPGLTAVQAIDLKSVTYADGSTWKLTGSMTCRTVPDALMLVGNR
jgi:hypothetical protein